MLKKTVVASLLAVSLSAPVLSDTVLKNSISGQSTVPANSPIIIPEYTGNTKSITTDIVVFYTDEGVIAAGGIDELYDYIDKSLSESNDYMTRNSISITRRISAVMPFPDEVQEPLASPAYLENYVDDNSAELERRFGASYYVLVVGSISGNRAGVATTGGGSSVVMPFDGGGVEYDVMGHEIGHNDGLKHELEGDEDFDSAAGSECGGESSLMSSNANNRVSNFLSSPDVFNSETGTYCGDLSLGQDVRGYYFDAVENDKIVNKTLTFDNYIEPIRRAGSVELNLATNVYGESDDIVTLMVGWNDIEYDLSSVEVYAKGVTADGDDFQFDNVRLELTEASGDATLELKIVDDVDFEDMESFEVGLRYPVAVNVVSEPIEVFIQSDELAPKGDVEVGGSATIGEGESANIVLSRVGGSRGELIVNVAVENGTAQNGDYALEMEQVVFVDGELSKAVKIAAIDDSYVEEEETLTVIVSTDDEESNASGEVSIRITDNDEPKGNLQISGTLSITEGDSSDIVVTRLGGSQGRLVATLTAENNTAQSNDYSMGSTQVVFEDGEVSKSISVSAVDDSLVEGSESFVIKISTTEDGSSASGEVGVTILDNDKETETPQTPQTPTESGGGSGGGSMSFGVLLLGIVATLRRFKTK